MSKNYRKILYRYTKKILPLKHVVGIGYGKKVKKGKKTNEDSIVVMVEKKVPEKQLSRKDIIPPELEDFKTDVQETGKLQLLKNNRNKKLRPAPGGVSIGHYKISAGTLGAIVKDKKTGEPLILSNNHVLANITNGHDGRSKKGDPILQPGSYDNGDEKNDVIGHLERFIPLKPNKTLFNPVFNTVDCAVAKPVNKNAVDNTILGIGKIKGTKEPEADMKIIKSGRTTGVTEGNVKAIDSIVNVSISEDEEALFKDQIVTSPMSQAGDSGSLILDTENNAVGLLFAGSNKSTVCNKITNVMKELNIDFFEETNEENNEEDNKEERDKNKKDKTNEEKNEKKIDRQKKGGQGIYTIFLVLILLVLIGEDNLYTDNTYQGFMY